LTLKTEFLIERPQTHFKEESSLISTLPGHFFHFPTKRDKNGLEVEKLGFKFKKIVKNGGPETNRHRILFVANLKINIFQMKISVVSMDFGYFQALTSNAAISAHRHDIGEVFSPDCSPH
jgi:hypothetical protein